MDKRHFSVILIILLPFFLRAEAGGGMDSIYIGASMSLTGAYATQGVPAHNGYLLCQEHINNDGGLLGKAVRFVIYDDESNTDRTREIYRKLIEDRKVDAVLGPYGSTLTEAVADITEGHQMAMISPLAATSSIWEQGREYLFMVLPPAELFLAGLIDLAKKKGYHRVGILQEDQLFPSAAGDGAAKLAEKSGMEVVFHYTYPSGTEDFSPILNSIEEQEVEVLGMAASSLSDFISFVEQKNQKGVELKMFGTSGAVDEFQEELGEAAELKFGLSAWEPTLDNPGIERFTEDYKKRFDRTPSFHAAGAYGSCQLLAEAIKRTESLDQDRLRDELRQMETTTVFSDYAVDERGFQTANRGLFIQWQDGEKAIVWPAEAARGEVRDGF